AMGGHLATVRSVQENAWIHGSFASFDASNRHLWIGLSDAATEGIFEWSSGEPNDVGGEDQAIILSPTSARSGLWNDLDGTRTLDADPIHGVAETAPWVEIALKTFAPADVYCDDDPSCETQLDQTVGVSGFLIERFEDEVLEPGITIMAEGSGTFASSVPAGDITTAYPEAVWDGSACYLPTVRNDTTTIWPLTIRVEPGARVVGIGLGDVESVVHLVVNGVSFGDVRLVPGYDSTKNARGTYVRVEARGVRPIRDVQLVPMGRGQGDGVFVDHLAIDRTTCVADLDEDGVTDIFDVLRFIEAVSLGDPTADWTYDGVLDIFDVTAYVNDFATCAP
ncbi:MAG: C-type lectin domain-containing protein, partial [Phycisphaerales bacterium]|nr:C-type lectin domain-containing protein [Phycisphaerales bacterium]